MSQSNRVLISRQSAQSFFEEARHPDPEMLRRRDAFFAYLDTKCIYHHEGNNLVMEIPDLDMEAAVQPAQNNLRTFGRSENFLVMDIPDVPLTVVYGHEWSVSYGSIREKENNDYPVEFNPLIAA